MTKSRWHISTDARNALALVVGALTLIATVWGVSESSISGLSDRIDRFDRIDTRMGRLEAKGDKIEALLIDCLLRIDVPSDESTAGPAAQLAGLDEGARKLLPAKPVLPRTGVPHRVDGGSFAGADLPW